VSGIVQHVMRRSPIDFSQLGAGQTMQFVIAKAVPIFSYRQANLIARYHPTGSTLTTGQYVLVTVIPEAPSPDDPTYDFVLSGTTLASAQFGTGSPFTDPTAPALVVAPFTLAGQYRNLGTHARVLVTAGQGGSAAPGRVFLSIDFGLKSE